MAVTETVTIDYGGDDGTPAGTGYPPTPPTTPPPTPADPPAVPAPTQRVPSTVAPVTVSLAALVIPVAATPSQVLAVSLGNQACRIDVYQKSTGLFADLYVSDVAVVTGVLCRDRNVWVVDAYRGFTGDLTFYDTQGSDDPQYEGLGTRWLLVWLYSPT